jgi:uncharacterized protein (TIGR02594 family)
MDKQLVAAIQQRLKDLDWYTGSVDGVAGTLTETAVTDFKRASGLKATPFVGIVTLHALFDDAAKRKIANPVFIPSDPAISAAWMTKAKLLEGTREVAGAPSNPVILSWAKYLDLSATYTNDGIAWCGLFVGFCLKSTTPQDPLPSNPLGARAWLGYGKAVSPSFGAVLVFWRGSKAGWQGHVGFYVGEDNNNFYVLGGNQSDSVNVSKIAKSRLLGARAPKSVPFNGRVVRMVNNDKLSEDEA